MGFDSETFSLYIEDKIAIVSLLTKGKPMSQWAEQALTDYFLMVDHLKNLDLLGVIFMTDHSQAFGAGTNLELLQHYKTKEQLSNLVARVHNAFSSLEILPFPSIAAIASPWLGIGFEFALACTARIGVNSPKALVGLPDCLYGLLPTGGATQRLPRLIGASAIELIIKGRVFTPIKALEAGLIDRIVEEDTDFLHEAINFVGELASDQSILKRSTQDLSNITAEIQAAEYAVIKAARGQTPPGPLAALKAIENGSNLSLEDGLELEREYFVNVALSPEANGMLNTVFLGQRTDNPKSLLPRNASLKPINKVAIIGFGTMGVGISVDVLRRMQIPIIVTDTEQGLDKGIVMLRKNLESMKLPAGDLMKYVTTTTTYEDEYRDVDLVIEAVFENYALKQQIYQKVCSAVSSDCLIASNTSTIPITQLAEGVSNPERFVGAHFFSPVPKMELLEIIKGEKTTQDTINNLIAFAAAIKKRPLICKDSPGFVVNALLLPYFENTFDLLEKGVAIETIDKAMLKFGLPVGPIRLIEEVGIDVPYNSFYAMGLEPPQTLKNMVESGRLGLKKSGQGFFMQDGSVDPGAVKLIPVNKSIDPPDTGAIQGILFSGFVKKGKELLDKKIVNDPRDVDMGTIWGLGFPSYTGGPLKWADLTGFSVLKYGKRFYD